ncbi:kinetochore protein NDC80 homolog [Hylaeus volcanicus]|uniref:kinetochore protein NDC80 homolog n=1 Tax=Hylaeus volcanicus TaxID=313075 RepID=UPI0023B85F0B|nr:kinetochore protein NDC80 homolog [Hylaeus volcanicus]
MRSSSAGRRSSTNPVRISVVEREEVNLMRTDTRKTQINKPKISTSSVESSHIPRLRAVSCDRLSNKIAGLKETGKTPLRHGSMTPKTHGSSNRGHLALPTGRRSLSADRASSISAKGSKKDTRLISDKVYQTHMLYTIDTYFSNNQFSYMLNSNGSMKPVTLKMFVEVSAHLLKMLGIKQGLTISNYVEELPKIAKKLHYPGVIAKSWLKTANAMHSWPNVLAWISWLVDICQVREIALEKYNLENLPFVGDEREASFHRYNLFAMLDFYNAWNDERVEEEAALVEKYLQEIEEQQGVNEEDLNNARFELEKETNKLQTVEENANTIDAEVKHLQEVLVSLRNDEEMQLSDIRAKEEYTKTIALEADQLEAENNTLCDQIRLQNQHRDELLMIIEQQSMSKAERDKILEKCMEMQNYTHQFDDHLQDIQKELYAMDIKLASINSNLTKAVLAYNKEIIMHVSDDMGVDLEELKMPEKGINHPEIMDILNVKASLMDDLKESIKKQIVENECLVKLNSNELENLQEKLKILEDESSDVANDIKEKKTLIKKIKTDAKNEELKLKEQIKILQNDIKEIQDSMPDRQKISVELEESTDKLDAVRRRMAHIEENAKLFFDKFYEILNEHRNEVSKILEKLNKLDAE